MDDLIESCKTSHIFPRNLIAHNCSEHAVKTYIRELDKRSTSSELFCVEGDGAVDFWDLEKPGAGKAKSDTEEIPLLTRQAFQYKRTSDTAEVQSHLRIAQLPKSSDPLCRFVFIHGRKGSSRDILRITRNMLSMVMTYHQIKPSFLDFLFSFGKQDHANPQDFHYSGFRQQTNLNASQAVSKIPLLGRSGRTIELCYSLRSVERSSPTEWSIRALAAQHTFDVQYGHSNWLILKGNEFTNQRIRTETESQEASDYENVPSCFASAMAIHETLSSWAGENWRWYINDMEREVQKLTQKTLGLQVLNPRSPPAFKSRFSRVETGALVLTSPTPKPKKTRSSKTSSVTPANLNVAGHGMPNSSVALTTVASANLPQDPMNDPLADDFTFSDLQRIEQIEEHANEALLVLTLNNDVLLALKQNYESIVDPDQCPPELKLHGAQRVAQFGNAISGVLREMQIQKTRVQTLLRLLADRKTLLYGIIDFRNLQASKQLAEKAQFSSEHMEYMTQQMHDLAEKTKRETVSMKIITLVTLFFLPGTFISTLMSTDIIKFPRNTETGKMEKVVSQGAINIFVAITVPLMILTFAAWGLFYQYIKWQDRKAKEKMEHESKA